MTMLVCWNIIYKSFVISFIQVNLLFTTDVIEEGIHVPGCSSVIRFDLPKTIRSYVQSRGRARQANSQFIMMLERYDVYLDVVNLEVFGSWSHCWKIQCTFSIVYLIICTFRGNTKQRNQLFDIIKSEHFMTDDSVYSGLDIFSPRACTVEKAISYCVDSTGASVTLDSSVTLIHQYCGKLKGNK